MIPKKYLYFPANSTIHKSAEDIKNGKINIYPTLVHIKNSCNVTASISKQAEEIYVQDIVQNSDLSKKIHIRPDFS